jgi:hypothetical protein
MPIYDVENRFSYYKSYNDNIPFGPAKPGLGDTTWLRTSVGSVAGGSLEGFFETIYSKYFYEVTNPLFRSGEIRYVRLASANQTIEDSKVPDSLRLYTTGSFGSGSIVILNTDPNILGNVFTYGFLFSRDGQEITGSSGQRVNNIEWVSSSPFEKKYFGVPRDLQNGSYSFNANYTVSTISPDIFHATPQPVPINSVPSYEIVFGETAIIGNTRVINNNVNCYRVPLFGAPLLNYVFGSLFGDPRSSYNFVFGINPKPVTILNNLPAPYTGFNPVYVGGPTQPYFTGSSIGYSAEGWKYGIYNAIPTNFSAVFRQNHYGQFRDMLEQRIYTKTYNDPIAGGPMDANGGITFISGSALVGESDNSLTASIYNGTNIAEAYRVNPYGSGIFDIEYRASQPWHDEDTRTSPFGRRRV